MLTRFPRTMAWLVTLLVIGLATSATILGIHTLSLSSAAERHHAHGVIVAIKGDDRFALKVAGHPGVEWFRPAPGAPISMAHLWRHLHEGAATDVTYQMAGSGMMLAWSAD